MACSLPVPSRALALESRKLGGVLRMTSNDCDRRCVNKSQLADNDDGPGAEDEMIGNQVLRAASCTLITYRIVTRVWQDCCTTI